MMAKLESIAPMPGLMRGLLSLSGAALAQEAP